MPSTGDKPGAGVYICNSCGQAVTLENDDEELPPCPSCKELDFTS